MDDIINFLGSFLSLELLCNIIAIQDTDLRGAARLSVFTRKSYSDITWSGLVLFLNVFKAVSQGSIACRYGAELSALCSCWKKMDIAFNYNRTNNFLHGLRKV